MSLSEERSSNENEDRRTDRQTGLIFYGNDNVNSIFFEGILRVQKSVKFWTRLSYWKTFQTLYETIILWSVNTVMPLTNMECCPNTTNIIRAALWLLSLI